MTLQEAFEELINSEDFKNMLKQQDKEGGKYRMQITRYKRGELGQGTIAELLIANGYTITADKTGTQATKKE